MSMLEVKDLRVSYGGIEALRGISFKVEEGQIVTLIGANGAGKSTTLRTISGIVRAKGGSILYEGHNILGLDAQKIVERGISLVPEGRRLFPNLTVTENLLLAQRPGGMTLDEARSRAQPKSPSTEAQTPSKSLRLGSIRLRRRA